MTISRLGPVMRRLMPVQASSADRQRRLAEVALETQRIRTRELEAQLEALRADYDGLRDRQAAAEHHSFQQVGVLPHTFRAAAGRRLKALLTGQGRRRGPVGSCRAPQFSSVVQGSVEACRLHPLHSRDLQLIMDTPASSR